MTITYLRNGTVNAAPTTSPHSVTHNATVNAGDLAILIHTTRNDNDGTDTGPGGLWTQIGTVTGGAGSFAEGTGNVRTTAWWLACAGTEDGAAVSYTWDVGTANRCGIGNIIYFSKTEATWVTPVFVTGTVTTADTSWDMVATASLAMADNDVVVAISSSSLEGIGATARSLTATGVTFGTVTNRINEENANGFDAKLLVDSAPVTTGVTATPTHSVTFTGNTAGSGMVIRLREAAAGSAPKPTGLWIF